MLGEKKRKIEEDKEKAVELRQRSLETFAETKKRKGDSGDGEEPSKRNIRNDVMNYLREKVIVGMEKNQAKETKETML